jgi:hypothetical protein
MMNSEMPSVSAVVSTLKTARYATAMNRLGSFSSAARIDGRTDTSAFASSSTCCT